MSLSPVRLNNKNNLTVQYSDQVGRKSRISAALAEHPPSPRWRRRRRWWDLELRTTWLCFLSCRLQEQCAQQRLMWKRRDQSQIRAEPSGKLSGETECESDCINWKRYALCCFIDLCEMSCMFLLWRPCTATQVQFEDRLTQNTRFHWKM